MYILEKPGTVACSCANVLVPYQFLKLRTPHSERIKLECHQEFNCLQMVSDQASDTNSLTMSDNEV